MPTYDDPADFNGSFDRGTGACGTGVNRHGKLVTKNRVFKTEGVAIKWEAGACPEHSRMSSLAALRIAQQNFHVLLP